MRLKHFATVSGWTLVSRVLGLVRDRLFAGAFGASLALDAFMLAFQVPNLLRNLFGEGALSSAFIPRYVQERGRDPEAAESFAGAVLTRLALGLSLVCGVALIVAAGMVAWGSERSVLVAHLAIPQLPFLIFICIAAIMAGVLNARGHFFVPAFAPVILNLCLIATVGFGEEEVWYLPYAVLFAGISQVLLHGWALARCGGVPPLRTASTPAVRELRHATFPVLVAAGIYQLNALGDAIIAYVVLGAAAEGAVAILYFGNRLLQFPMALIGHGITTAAYPELSRRADQGWSALGDGLRAAAGPMAYFLLPAAVGLLVTAEPLVRTIYQTGAFDETSVMRTVLVTQFLALALVPIGLSKLQVRCFHAMRDQRTPMRWSLVQVAINLVLNLILVHTPLREAGLALATAISSGLGCFAYAILLRRRGSGWPLARGLGRPLVAAAVMGAVVWAVLWTWPQPEGAASGIAALRLGVVVVTGAGVYLVIAGVGGLRRTRHTPAESERPD